VRKSSFSTGLLVGLAAAFLISGPTVFASPMGWWKFDEGSGSTAYDSAGSHNGSITGAAWTTEGEINSALHFDASGDYVTITGLEPGNQWTFAAWVKSDVNISFFDGPQRDNILLDSSQCHISLGTNILGREGNLSFAIPLCGTLYSSKNFWKADEWYHITCTWAEPIKAVYVNGILDNFQNQICIGGGGWAVTYIGGEFTHPSDSFDGVIDDVHIYNTALSAAEIWQVYGEGFGGIAFGPDPCNGAADVNTDKTLTWTPGKDANSHNVYFGTDFNNVNNANNSSPDFMGNFDVNNFTTVDLEYGTTYYWRVDEVNEPNLWKGDVWTFRTRVNVLHVPSEYSTIQTAIDASFNGDTVVVAPGTYTGAGNRDIDFKGKAITVCSTDPNDPNIVAATVVDCQGSSGNPHRGFYFHNSEDANSIVAGLTITNGFIQFGGAISCTGSSPVITNCIINNNESESGGGIDCFNNSSPTITNCTISNNRSTLGGGIFCSQSGQNIPSITGCTIAGNSASFGGGIDGCWGPITNCIITGNSAGSGGGLNNCGGPITNCTINNNSAVDHGGGLMGCDGPITNCTISGNSAGGSGGGLFSCSGHITNCIISNNNAQSDGGGFFFCDIVTNCTIIGNIAGLRDCSYYGGGTADRVTNCIIRDNWPDQIGGSSVTYSNVQGGYTGEGNIDADPCFAFSSNYHIMPDSPCVDAGTNDPCGGLPAADIEGTTRPLDGNADANAVADMGAYELVPDSPFIAVSAVNLYFTQDWPNLDPQTKTLIIKNCGGQPFHWQIIEDCNWLRVSPESGTGQISDVNVTIDPNGLTPGRYTCGFEIQDINALNNPVTINVAIGQTLLVPQDFNTIQKAIDAAYNADTVLVADGNYTGTGNANLDFRGKIITVRSENGPNNCIINCQGSDYGFHFQNGESEDSIIDGFTLANAYKAGICCSCCSSPTIKNCIIRNNGGYDDYGGILCEVLGYPVITGCTITGNEGCGIYYGFNSYCNLYSIPLNASITDSIISNNEGGIFAGRLCMGNLKVTNCAITGNSGYYIDGGGIVCLDYSQYDPEGGYTGVSLEITSSIVSGNTGDWYGGGIICGDGSKIIDCNISGNSATWAAGIYCTSSTTVADCTVTGNSATRGAGIYCSGGSDSIITGCTITGNTATEYAGGIRYMPHHSEEYEERNNPTIKNCIITGNSAGKGEAGISCWGNGNPTITNCTITGNTAVEYGGGISCRYDSNAAIADCNISGNSAGNMGKGGGIYCSASSPVITNCTISDSNGSGIYCDTSSSPTITNCSITGNTGMSGPGGTRGGGIFCYSSSPIITNCTITGNLVGRYGGGIYSSMSNSTITNSILYGNEAPNGPEIYLISTSNLWLSYNDVQGGQAAAYVGPDCTLNWGMGNIDADPRFVNPANGDYHLKSEGWRWDSDANQWTWDDVTSRCIDAGNPGSPLADEPLTLVVDPLNRWGQNLRIDMGAFGGTAEASMPPYDWALLADLTNDGLVDLTDYAFQAADWLNSADQQSGDLNRDSLVDASDLALLVEDWLEQTSWH